MTKEWKQTYRNKKCCWTVQTVVKQFTQWRAENESKKIDDTIMDL